MKVPTASPNLDFPSSRVDGRSPGERAFDRCFFPFALYLLHLAALGLVTVFRSGSDGAPPPLPAWVSWLLFGLGCLLAVHWGWACRSVVRAWRDPAARILRLSSLALLFFAALIVGALWRAPFATP